MKLQSEKKLDELPKEIVTGDNSTRIIQIDGINHVKYQGEGNYQEHQINIFCVVHEKGILFENEIINHNLMHLPISFEE